MAKRQPNVFQCQFDAVLVEVELHDHSEVEVTGVKLAAFGDSCRGPGIGIPQFDTTGSAAIERRLKANEACGRDMKIVFVGSGGSGRFSPRTALDQQASKLSMVGIAPYSREADLREDLP